MSNYSLPPLISSLIFLLFGAFVYFKGKRKFLNFIFFLFCFVTFWWQFSWFILFNIKSKAVANYLIKIGYSGIIFIPFVCYHFVVLFLGEYYKEKLLLTFSYIVGTTILLFLWGSNLFIQGYYKYSWGYYPKANLLHFLYLLYISVIILRGFFLLNRTLRKEVYGVRRNQIRYIHLAFLFFAISSIDFLLNYRIVEFYPIGFVFILVSLGIFTYAIVKHRLLDITLVGRYATIYFLSALVTTLILLPLGILLGKRFLLAGGIIFVVILISSFLYPRLQKLFEPFVDKVILGGKYLYWKKLEPEEFLKISAYTSLELAEKVSLALYNLLNLEGVSFFVYKKEKKQFRPLYSVGIYEELIGEEPIPWIKYSSDHPFIKHLSKENRIISQENNPFKSYLDKIPFEIILPLFVYKSLKGFILLSSKKGKELFHPQDLERLERLKTTLETHLSHSLFMEERALYSYKLAHDMKNIVEKSIQPLLEKTTESPSKQNLGKLLFQVCFLREVLRDNFDMGRIYRAIIYKDYPRTPFSYKDVVFAVKNSLENFALSKNLYLKLEIPSKVPPCLGNPKDIYKLLYNLVLNGLKFTEEGGVKIIVKAEKDEILTEVKDTGCGIASDRLDDIFTPFFQIKDEEKQEGVGLGLTIVRDIIEANNGKIWVESELNKGTTFYFTLPQAK